jgi:hypothetical protein
MNVMTGDVVLPPTKRDNADVTTNNSDPSALLEVFRMDDILTRNILPFVGANQFRFVGAVNRRLRTVYLSLFSPTTTYDYVTSVEHAHLCYYDFFRYPASTQLKILGKVAAKHNYLNVLKYLLRQNCPLDAKICTAAAKLDIWILSSGCCVRNVP